jgi:SAM-dependent methyltransferase
MASDDKTHWDQKYQERPEKWQDPDPFLIEAYRQFLESGSPGYALDVAGGAGRHAIWLASRGWRVKIVDISVVGLDLARHKAIQTLGRRRAAESISVQAADLSAAQGSSPDLGRDLFDLVVVFRYLNRELFPALVRALKPGGILIYETYTIGQLKFVHGPHDARFLLQADELRQAFSGLEILQYEEKVGSNAVAELVARKYSR